MVMFQSKYHGNVPIKRYFDLYLTIVFWLEHYHGILIGTLPWYFDWNITMVFWLEHYHGILIGTLPWYFDWNLTMVVLCFNDLVHNIWWKHIWSSFPQMFPVYFLYGFCQEESTII
jgi:hypothetical protein